MYQKKINLLNLFLFVSFTSLQTNAADLIEGQSGEIISIPAPQNINENHLTFKTS